MKKPKKMKKKKDWVRKKQKRESRKRDRGIVDLMMVIHHFFAALTGWLDEMDDPRNQSYIVYTQSDLVWMGLLKNMCAARTMRGMEENFNEDACIETLRILSGDKKLDEMPHSDTLNYYLEKLSPQCLADIRKRMIKSLIRGKSFYRAKLLGKHWRVIVDGTGLRDQRCQEAAHAAEKRLSPAAGLHTGGCAVCSGNGDGHLPWKRMGIHPDTERGRAETAVRKL